MHSLLNPLHTFNGIALLLVMSILSLPAQSASNITTQAVDTGPIVVTIKPLYSLVAQLTDGIEKPLLLMEQVSSPHHYSMRPSERRLLSNARMIVWIGPQMETYLQKVIHQQQAVIVTAMQAQGLKLLKKRARDGHQHDDEHSHDNQADDLAIDPHIWLSTQNAIAISRHINHQLIASDPKNSVRYQQNLEHLISRITKLSAEIKSELKDSQQPYITYHDAFQYFEAENQLNFMGSISLDEETGTSLKHLRKIRDSIEEKNIQCLLYQPPRPDIVDTLAEHTRIRTAPLDPLGLAVNNPEDAWFLIMRSTADNIRHCLKI